MNATVTSGIVLARTDYHEADRILTMLTPDHGKIRVIAKGVRKVKSKLAGGIELFSVSHISFLPGKKEIGTLISTRLDQHYAGITTELNRTMLGYDILKLFNRITEDNPEAAYFELLQTTLHDLNQDIPLDIMRLWLYAHLLQLTGHQPNLTSTSGGQKLTIAKGYSFSFEDMAFNPNPQGTFKEDHIKLLRLALSVSTAKQLLQVKGIEQPLPTTLQLTQSMLGQYVKLS